MSFLYPLIWLATLAAAVPLWLHLRQRKPENLKMFSTLRFLDDLPQPRRGSFRLRDRRLFALRLLALLLLVAAFSWPHLKSSRPVVTASRVHILDMTASQQVEDDFRADLDAVVEAVDSAPASVQNAVVALRRQPTVEVAFAEEREMATRHLRELEPSHQRGSYLEAFRLASTLLDQSLGLEKEIVVHGDFQSNQWSEHQTSPPFLRDIEVRLAGEPAGAARRNVALHEPRSRFFFLGDKTFVDLTIDLVHLGMEGTAHVDITANGKSVLDGDFELVGPSGTVTLHARWQTDPERWLEGTATVEAVGPDALAADNQVYFSVPPVREGKVALLARSPYLRLALAPDVMRGRWTAERLDPGSVDPGVPLAELADVLVVEASYAQSEKVRGLVLRYLNNERGVVLLLDRITPVGKGFLRELGFEVVETLEAVASPQKFRYFNVYHPIFQPFVDGELGDLLLTEVHRHQRLRSKTARPLIYGHAGGSLMAEGRRTKGRLLVFTFGFGLEETNWPVQPSFIPFLDLTLQYARAGTPIETSWRPGELYTLDLPEDREVRDLVVRSASPPESPRGDHAEEVRRFAVEAGNRPRWRLPDEPGLYRVHLDAEREPYRLLAVNPAREESRLVYDAEPAALAAWTLGPSGESPPPTASDFEIVPRSEVLRQHLWWWLALLGLLVFLAETFMLGLRRERT